MLIEQEQVWENRSIVTLEVTDLGNGNGQGNANGIGNGQGSGLVNNPNYTDSSIPEPATYAIVFGLIALFFVLRRRAR